MSVRSDVAKHEDIVNAIATNGKIEPEEDFQAHAPMATTVKKIFVHEGDFVKKGQQLTEGPVVPHEILEVCGPQDLQDSRIDLDNMLLESLRPAGEPHFYNVPASHV